MDFFDDPFDSIIREFFGEPSFRKARKEDFIIGEEEDRTIDFIEDDNKIYLIFELPGFEEKDISVAIKGRKLEIVAKKVDKEGIPNYLHQKLKRGFVIQKTLPARANTKKMSYTVNNGVLEITFEKHKGGNYNGAKKIKIN